MRGHSPTSERSIVLSSARVGNRQSLCPSRRSAWQYLPASTKQSFAMLSLGSWQLPLGLSGSSRSHTRHVFLSTATPATLVSNPVPPGRHPFPAELPESPPASIPDPPIPPI